MVQFIYFSDLKFFTLRMLWPIINSEMKFLADQRWRHNMSSVLTRASQQHENYYASVNSLNIGILSPRPNGVSPGQQSLMTAFLRVCVFIIMAMKRIYTKYENSWRHLKQHDMNDLGIRKIKNRCIFIEFHL